MKCSAVVLRTRAYGESDLIVECLTAEQGRRAFMARAARKSRKRYSGALSLGNRLELEVKPRQRGLSTVVSCEKVQPIDRIRNNLDGFQFLSLGLELAQRLCAECQPDHYSYQVLSRFIDALEQRGPVPLFLLRYEICMLTHHGYGLDFGQCVVSGKPADAISLERGGAIASAYANAADSFEVSPQVLDVLTALSQRKRPLETNYRTLWNARCALDRIWSQVLGQPLTTSRFIDFGAHLDSVQIREDLLSNTGYGA